jgi:hypothetical protein
MAARDGINTRLEWISGNLFPSARYFDAIEHPLYGPLQDPFDVGVKKLYAVTHMGFGKPHHFADLETLEERGYPRKAMFVALADPLEPDPYGSLFRHLHSYLERNEASTSSNPDYRLRAEGYRKLLKALGPLESDLPSPDYAGTVTLDGTQIIVPRGPYREGLRTIQGEWTALHKNKRAYMQQRGTTRRMPLRVAGF